MTRIDLNCDMGELPELIADGTEEALMEQISSVNVACGAHAGDEATMEATIRAALRHGRAIGAHPGFPDRADFGRRALPMTAEEIARTVRDQILALAGVAARCGAELGHVKPHGALYNVAAQDRNVARAIAEGVSRAVAAVGAAAAVTAGTAPLKRRPTLVGLAGSAMLEVFAAAGFAVAAEAFADRLYEPDGTLRSRRLPGAVLTDPAGAAAQAIGIVRDDAALAAGGSRLAIRADTLCLHGDTPGAARIARAVAEALRAAGITIAPLGF